MAIDKDTFEAARNRWLQKLNGRTFIEYAVDMEKEEIEKDEVLAKSRTPEYLQIWVDAAKRVAAKGG